MGLAFWAQPGAVRQEPAAALLGEQLELPSAGLAAPELRLDRLLRPDGRAQPVRRLQLLDRRPGSTSRSSALTGLMLVFMVAQGFYLVALPRGRAAGRAGAADAPVVRRPDVA